MKKFSFTIYSLPRRIASLLLLVIAINASAQNYSGLLDKELKPEIGNELIGGLVDRLLYGDFKGTVTTVKVLDDRDVSLNVSINFIGYNEGYLQAALTDDNKNILKGFSAKKAPISSGANHVEMTFNLDKSQYPNNTTFNAPLLVVMVSKDDKGTHGIRSVFKINKTFTNPLVLPENIVLPVKLIPVKTAGELGANPPSENGGGPGIVIPKRNIYEVIKDKPVINYKPDAIYMTFASAKLATTPAASPTAEAPKKVVLNKMVAGSVIANRSVLSLPVTTAQPAVPASPDKTPAGPVNEPLSFWGDFIYSDVDFESQMKISNVSLNIYPDKNPYSGIYYYLPIAYDIKYDKEKGYAFNMDYGTSRSDGAENKVRMSGTLVSGISLNEVKFIDKMMEAYRKQNPGVKLEKALPLPVAEAPVITIGDELKNFGISNVNINNANSVSEPIEFSWMTDGTTAAELENLLKVNSGIIGKVKFKPQGTELPTQEIPVRIRLIDENTFGRFAMLPQDFRTKNWRNETPFPVKLKYVHLMTIVKDSKGKEGPVIYSWDAGNQEVPPKAQVQFDASTVPPWLDNYKGVAARIWLDYSVVDTCNPCIDGVFSKIVSSTTKPQLSDVAFRVIPFFDEYKISYLDIQMRSQQGEPSGKTEITFPPVHITQDGKDYTLGRIYVPSGAEPALQYRVTAVTKDGAEYTSNWLPRNLLSIPFGSFQLVEQFPALKKN
jgi:hypothetical protein